MKTRIYAPDPAVKVKIEADRMTSADIDRPADLPPQAVRSRPGTNTIIHQPQVEAYIRRPGFEPAIIHAKVLIIPRPEIGVSDTDVERVIVIDNGFQLSKIRSFRGSGVLEDEMGERI